jgi:hypothetical protein
VCASSGIVHVCIATWHPWHLAVVLTRSPEPGIISRATQLVTPAGAGAGWELGAVLVRRETRDKRREREELSTADPVPSRTPHRGRPSRKSHALLGR